jgi:ribose/xylose/arabinose/galactoside ABC-type transport system permease subunit
MTALARTIARAFAANSPQVNIVQQSLLLALAGLFVLALIATYGIDLSPGFF